MNPVWDANERAPASERPASACVAGERSHRPEPTSARPARRRCVRGRGRSSCWSRERKLIVTSSRSIAPLSVSGGASIRSPHAIFTEKQSSVPLTASSGCRCHRGGRRRADDGVAPPLDVGDVEVRHVDVDHHRISGRRGHQPIHHRGRGSVGGGLPVLVLDHLRPNPWPSMPIPATAWLTAIALPMPALRAVSAASDRSGVIHRRG